MQCVLLLYPQHNAKHLRLFSSFYWIDLALHMLFSVASAYLLFSMHTEICEQVVREAPNDEPMDMESCESVYSASAWLVTLAMAINMLIKVFHLDKTRWEESRDCIHTLVFYSSILLLPSIVTPMSLSESRNKRRIGMPTLLLLPLHPFTSLPIRKSLSLLPARNIFPTRSRHLPTTTINLKSTSP